MLDQLSDAGCWTRKSSRVTSPRLARPDTPKAPARFRPHPRDRSARAPSSRSFAYPSRRVYSSRRRGYAGAVRPRRKFRSSSPSGCCVYVSVTRRGARAAELAFAARPWERWWAPMTSARRRGLSWPRRCWQYRHPAARHRKLDAVHSGGAGPVEHVYGGRVATHGRRGRGERILLAALAAAVFGQYASALLFTLVGGSGLLRRAATADVSVAIGVVLSAGCGCGRGSAGS